MSNSQEVASFGKELCRFIKEASISHVDFYRSIGITKPYFYDICSGKTNPPPAELQIRMVEFLNLVEGDRSLFFELAGRERNETPVDIAWYLSKNKEAKNMLREEINYEVLFGHELH